MCLCTRIFTLGGFRTVEILLITSHSVSLVSLTVEVYLLGIKIKRVQLRFLANGEESLFIVLKQYMLQGR